MTTSDRAFVWVWLPGAAEPVVAGRLDAAPGRTHTFTYGRSYRERDDAIPLYAPELPLTTGAQRPDPGWEAHGCVLDSGPDYWGRRVILAKHFAHLDPSSDTDSLGLITYLLESGSDRIGALDFQESAQEYVPRDFEHSASLAQLMTASDDLQNGRELSPALSAALLRGTSIGGARPKALLDDGGRKLIAKFSSSTDPYPVVQAEGAAMRLAAIAGIDVPATEVVHVADRAVLIVDRFDRENGSPTRRMMVSASTMLHISPDMGYYATYPQLADLIRRRFANPDDTLHELFRRIVFNIIVGNTDDHARNHAAFWDGRELRLTPGYDISPQVRNTGEATQALAIARDGDRRSRLQTAERAADVYHLTSSQAKRTIEELVAVVSDGWTEAADFVGMSRDERERLRGGAVLNPSIFYRD